MYKPKQISQVWGNGYCVYCGKICSRYITMGTKRIVYIHKKCEKKWKYLKKGKLTRILK